MIPRRIRDGALGILLTMTPLAGAGTLYAGPDADTLKDHRFATSTTALPVQPDTQTFREPDSAQPAIPIAPPTLVDTLPVATPSDTVVPLPDGSFFSRPFAGFTFAWTLGSFPAFTPWQNNLPASLTALGITTNKIGVPSETAHGSAHQPDTLTLRFSVREPPNTYNLSFPLGLAVSFPFDTLSRLTADVSFMLIRKRFAAVVEADTLDNTIRMEQRFGSWAPWTGLTYHRSIPPAWFTIATVRHAQLTVGIGAAPWVTLSRTSRIEQNTGRRTDSFQPLFDTLLAGYTNTIRDLLPSYRATGHAVCWRAGITAIRFYSPHSGLEAGLHYTGQHYYFPNSSRSDLSNAALVRSRTPLRFTAHRLAIHLALLRGRAASPPDSKPSHEDDR